MPKWLFCTIACALGLAQAQSQSSKKSELTSEFLNSTQALEQDELANSEMRRDWLQDRFVLSAGVGAKYGSWGDRGFYSGGAAEYISQWPGNGLGNLSLFGAYGLLPSQNDNLDNQAVLSSAKDYRVGLGYQFLNRSPIHPGIAVSWGKAYYDFKKSMSTADSALGIRPIIYATGYNVDATVSYLANNWYYFSIGIGFSYTGKPGSTAKAGLDNSKSFSTSTNEPTVVFSEKDGKALGINQWNYPTFSFGIGIATPNLFPDEVEKRRQEREKARKKIGL